MPRAKKEEEFRREDCNEAEFNDQGQVKKRKKKQPQQQEAQRQVVSTEFLPTSMKKLRACVSCKLVLNRQRWIDLGKCPNCPSAGGLVDTTDEFSSLSGQIYPKMSWVAQYNGMKDLIPGVYAMGVNSTAGGGPNLDEYEEDY